MGSAYSAFTLSPFSRGKSLPAPAPASAPSSLLLFVQSQSISECNIVTWAHFVAVAAAFALHIGNSKSPWLRLPFRHQSVNNKTDAGPIRHIYVWVKGIFLNGKMWQMPYGGNSTLIALESQGWMPKGILFQFRWWNDKTDQHIYIECGRVCTHISHTKTHCVCA